MKINKKNNNLLKIKELLHRNTNENIEIVYVLDDSIWFESESDIVLYLNIYINKLRIIRAFLPKQRHGTMTFILKELKNYCIANNLDEIVIKSPSEPMISFAVKNNFEPVTKIPDNDNKLSFDDYLLKI